MPPDTKAAMTQGLFSDDPLDNDSDDALDRSEYAKHVTEVIRRVRTQGAMSSVLAIVGPWGGGKSTTLGMVRRRLLKFDENWIIADFTPWLYPDVDTMQAAFFRELNFALPKDGKWKNTGEKIENLGLAISPFGKFTTLLGVDSSEMIKGLSQALSGDTSINATKEKAEKALKEGDRPILVVIDDLDRLSPDELLMAFKLVRFVGRLPNVYYLLSYDERTLIDVIMRTDLAAGDARRAQDYMEKMVQVRLDLPALRDTQATALVNEAMASILTQNNVELDEDQVRRIDSAYEAMGSRLNTPRSIRRFFAQVDSFYRPTLAGEIDFVDFLCLTWLRTFEPQAYRFIHHHRGLLTQSTAGDDRRGDEGRKYWTGLLKKERVSEDHVDEVLQLLELLFAPAFSAYSQVQSPTVSQDLHLRRRVGHPDYFDRYFAFAIPSEDIPDSTVLKAFDLSVEGNQALETLAPRFLGDTARVSRKIRSLLERRRVDPRLVIEFVCAFLNKVPKSGGIFDNPRINVEFLVRDALLQIPAGEGGRLLEKSATSPATISLFAWEVIRLTKPSGTGSADSSSTLDWADIAIRTMSDRIKEVLHNGSWSSPNDVPSEIFRLLTPWRFLAPDDCRSFIDLKVQSWGLLPMLMRLVPESMLYGQDGPIQKLNAYSVDELSSFVSLERALEELAQEIADLPADSNVSGQWTIDPTDENRRALVLETLRTEAERAEARRQAQEGGDASNP